MTEQKTKVELSQLTDAQKAQLAKEYLYAGKVQGNIRKYVGLVKAKQRDKQYFLDAAELFDDFGGKHKPFAEKYNIDAEKASKLASRIKKALGV